MKRRRRLKLAVVLLGLASMAGAAQIVASAATGSSDAHTIEFEQSARPNPFRTAGPEKGERSDLAVPHLEGEPQVVTADELTRIAPRAGRLTADEARSLTSHVEVLAAADGRFFASAMYTAGESAVVRIESWTPDGSFLLRVPQNSVVTDLQATTVGGQPALTLFPTDAVAGGVGPRDVFVEANGVYYHILTYWLASDSEMLAIVERVLSEVSK